MAGLVRVVVVGGGVSGLATAYRLLADRELFAKTPTQAADSTGNAALAELRPRLEVVVVEPNPEGGGNIQTEESDGFTVEWGPNGFLDNAPETPRLARQLGIESRLLPAGDAAANRYIYVRGKLRPVPLAPPAFLFSDILTVSGRLRVLMEPMIPARPDFNESVYNFAARRIGPEAASVLVDSMVAGVYAGDSRALELGSCFLKLHTLERDFGGLIRGMIASRKAARAKAEAEAREATRTGEAKKQKSGGPAGPGGVLTSFDRGMQVLTQTLVAVLREEGATLRLGASAVTIARLRGATQPAGPPGDGATAIAATALARDPRWRVRLSNGEVLDAHALVMAAPPDVTADLLAASDPGIAAPLRAIPGSPLAVVGLAFDRAQLRRPVNGFGFLVAKGPGAPRCLGVLWDSAIYRGRAPEGSVLMRAMIGGARDPQVVEWDDARLLSQIADDLRLTMGVDAVPRRTWVFRHPKGIPQYTQGHAARLAEIERRAAAMPGLALTGNGYRGVSVNHCVEQSIVIARRVVHELTSAPRPPLT